MYRRLISLFLLAAFSLPSFAQEHKTGYVPSPFSKQLKAASAAAHGDMLKKLADEPLPEKYEAPWLIPNQNQGNCGSCWCVSGSIVVSNAFVKAGLAKADGSFIIAPNCVMWCYSTGGCNGDDASTVMRVAKKDGIAIEADFGPYKATGRGPCNKTAKRYKIKDFGYADANDDGSTDYNEIKAAIYKYGAVVITVNAGGLVDGERVSTSYGGRTNHQIIAYGWDNTKKGSGYDGAVLCRNQWGDGFGFERNGQKGNCWLGVNSSGHIAASGSSEVIWCEVENPNPPIPPTPPTPPTPPVPPVPPVPPAPQQTVTFTIPAYTFTVPGTFYNTHVTIPAQTITAPVTQSKGDCENCEVLEVTKQAAPPQPVVTYSKNQSAPKQPKPAPRRRLFR